MRNAWEILLIALAGWFWFVFRAHWVFRVQQAKRGPMDSFFMALCLSVGQMILSVYLLLFIRLLSVWSLALLLLAEDLLFARLRYGSALWERAGDVGRFFSHLRKGYVAPLILRRRFTASVAGLWRRKAAWFGRRWHLLLLVAIGLSYGLYVRAQPVLSSMVYGVTDLYVYTEWIKQSLANNIFFRGVYFYGMHNTITGFSLLFGFDVVTLLRLTGVLNGLLLLTAAYWVSTSLFAGRFVPALCVAVTCVLQVVDPSGRMRQSYLLAQEFSQLFMLIAAGFFLRYLHKPSKIMLFFFGVAMANTVFSHYYGAVILALFCIPLVVTHADLLLKNKARIFKQLAMVVSGALGVGLLPLAIGLIMGKPLEASFGWGFQSMSGGAGVAQSTAQGAQTFAGVLERVGLAISSVWTMMVAIAVALVVAVIFFAGRKNRPLLWRRLLGFTIYHLLLLGFMFANALRLPSLMDTNRLNMFYAVTGAMLYFYPLELALSLTIKQLRIVAASAVCAGMGFLAIHVPLCVPIETNRAQYDGAIHVYYDIASRFPRGQWTIVSPVEEMSMCLGQGYHYELYQFISEQEAFTWKTKVRIPTRYVFFYVEKLPLNYERIENINAVLPYPITEEEAQETIYQSTSPLARGDTAYIRYAYRRVLEAKMFYWAEAFMRAYPDDMELYYEDDVMRVYQFTQNMYQLTNFAIPYGYNGAAGPL